MAGYDIRDAFFLYWQKLAQHDDWIDLGMGMPPADFFAQALQVEPELRHGLAARADYQPQAGPIQVREALAAYEAKRTGLMCRPDNIMLVGGAIRGFSLVLDCLVNANTSLVDVVPTYPLLAGYAKYVASQYGCSLKSVRSRDVLDFKVQPDDLLQSLSPHGILYLTDPSNPTGRYTPRPLLAECASVCESLGAFMIVDQSCDIPFDYDEGRYRWAASRSVIRIRSFSKDLLLAGFRTGYIVATPELIETFSRRYAFSDGNAPVIVNNAILEFVGISNPLSGISEVVRSKVQRTLDELRLLPRVAHLISPEACYYILVKIDYPGSSWDLFDYLLQSGLNVVPGVLFGIDEREPWIRICCARKDEVLSAGLERLRKALSALGKPS